MAGLSKEERKIKMFNFRKPKEIRTFCFFCKKPIPVSKLGGVFSYKGKVELVCDNICCLIEFDELEKKKSPCHYLHPITPEAKEIKIPKKVLSWANKQEDPALAKSCWYLTSKGFKKKVLEMIKPKEIKKGWGVKEPKEGWAERLKITFSSDKDYKVGQRIKLKPLRKGKND